MTQKEFQEKHNLTDEEMERIRMICKMFNGKVISIKEIKDGKS